MASKLHMLVEPGADYRANVLDPNYPMPWERVRAVRFGFTDQIRCPICLVEPPLSPHIYGCGHILCLPCALRLHAASEGSSIQCRCPLCSVPVAASELRPAVLARVEPIQVGSPATFRKLQLSPLAASSTYFASTPASATPPATSTSTISTLRAAGLPVA